MRGAESRFFDFVSRSKNWDTNMGSLSCNIELRGHCTWNRVVRNRSPWPARARMYSIAQLHPASTEPRVCPQPRRLTRPLLPPIPSPNAQTTISVDVVPQRAVTKAVTGGVAFFVGKTLDINPRVKLGNLPVKVRPPVSPTPSISPPCAAPPPAHVRHHANPPSRQLEVGASIYKEGGETSDSDVLVFKVRSINALVNL